MTRFVLVSVCAVGLAGCFGGTSPPTPHGSASEVVPTGRLLIAVQLWPRSCPYGALGNRCMDAAPTMHRYMLTCDPDGGSVPNPHAACRAVGDYLSRRHRFGGCIGIVAGPGSTAVVSGTYARRPFHLKLESGYSWCGQPPALLRDYWVLSTFPCSTLVVRSGGRYPAWPRATGCMT